MGESGKFLHALCPAQAPTHYTHYLNPSFSSIFILYFYSKIILKTLLFSFLQNFLKTLFLLTYPLNYCFRKRKKKTLRFKDFQAMCGGAIIADFIPRNGGRRVSASDIWPNSPFAKLNGFSSHQSQTDHDDSLPQLKRPQAQPPLSLGISIIPFPSVC